MSQEEVNELKHTLADYQSEVERVRCQLDMDTKTLSLLKQGKVTNLNSKDDFRWIKHLNAVDALQKKHDRVQVPCWEFFVESTVTKVIFACYSPVQVVTKEELFELIAGFLPDDFEFYTLLGARGDEAGYSFIRDETDLAKVYSFICY